MKDKFEEAEQIGRDKFESLLNQFGITNYQFSQEKMDRIDCRFTDTNGKKYIVEIKVRERVWNPLYMELSKYNAMKQMIADGEADAGLYVNFIGDQCYIFNLNNICKSKGCWLNQVYCNRTTAEDSGQQLKQMICLPIGNARMMQQQDGKWV